MSVQPVLDVRELSLEFPTYRGRMQALSRLSLAVEPGEIVALVGESGSGKSVAAMATIGLLPPQLARITSGEITLAGHNILAASERSLADLRGKVVSMVFQEPMSALNPTLRIGTQIEQVLQRHEHLDRSQAAERALQLLAEVQVSDPKRVLRSYPFQLSGGMRQRVLIAMAFACNPRLLIADEPTTALDVTVQAQVLSLIREQARARGTAVLLITHDLAVVSQLCTRVYVMYAGEIVESGMTADVLLRPGHPYSRALLQSLPESAAPRSRLSSIAGTVPNLLHPPRGCRFQARCALRQASCQESPPFALLGEDRTHGVACWFPDTSTTALTARLPEAPRESRATDVTSRTLVSIAAAEVKYSIGRRWGRPGGVVHALNGIDLEIIKGETLAVVGESGCGKSTLAQLVMGLLAPTEGRVRFAGVDLRALVGEELRERRRRLQIVFQDPQASLDPRIAAWRIIAEPLQVARRLNTPALRAKAAELAELVGIGAEHLERYPHEFSGGQRQRLAIARALALQPELLVLDEPTSALDVSIQAQILNLLAELQSRLGLTYLFISHNVAVVRHVADRVAVMYLGQIVEIGTARSVLDDPQHPYTRQLIAAVPRLHQPLVAPETRQSEIRGNLELPIGCYFQSRCPRAGAGCDQPQVLWPLADARHVRCHQVQ